MALALLASVHATEAAARPQAGGGETQEAEDPSVLFEKGNELFTAGDLTGAEAMYERAFEMRKSFDVAANLGAVKLDLGKPAEAAHLFEHALEAFPVGGDNDKRRTLEERLADARSKSGRLRLVVTPTDAAVSIDGEPARRAAQSGDVYVTAGEHRVSITSDGLDAHEESMTFVAGEVATVEASLRAAQVTSAAPAPPPSSDAEPDESGEGPVWPIFVGAGLSLALVGAGVGLTVWGSSQQSSADEKRDELSVSIGGCEGGCEELRSQYGDADTGYNLGMGFFIAGGVAAVGTLVYGILRPTRSPLEPKVIALVLPSASGPIGTVALESRF